MTPSESGMAQAARRMLSAKAEQFTESVIREMTRLAMKHGAVNLSQGFPDFAAPAEIKEAARQAISDDINQYAITWGAKPLRDAIVEKFERTQGVRVDPEREITICCGSTEAMMSTMLAIINPGDEIVVFEPFYENYGPDAILSGAKPRFVKMRPPGNENSVWTFDEKELAAAFGPHTKAIILNTPNNPTGKVFTRAELEFIRDLCVRWNAFCITDEIYEHILYDGTEHISMARIDGMRDRTIVINGMSKTYSVTGWRVGWAIAPPEPTAAIRKVHDFLTVGAAAPLQQAGAIALKSPQSYYDKLATDYTVRRERLLKILTRRRFHGLQAARRVLHHDGHLALRFPVGPLSGRITRRLVRQISGRKNRRRSRARLQFLQRCPRRRHAGPLHLLQEGNHTCRRRGTAARTLPKHIANSLTTQ